MNRFDPAQAKVGAVLIGIDPSSLLSNRDELELSRLDIQRQLIASGIKRHTMIQVNLQGVIVQGNHGARAAAERGLPIDIIIVDLPYPNFGPILQIPVANR